MKKMLVLLGLLLSVATAVKADNEFRYIPNNGGGYIFFTYSSCVWTSTGEKIPKKYYVYTTNSNGVKTSDGCYEYKAPFYVIDWNSGGRTNIAANATLPIN